MLLISDALILKNGGLIKTRHNELRDVVANLDGKVFTPLHVCDGPLIYPGRAMWEGKAQTPRSTGANNLPALWDKTDQKGDLFICNLWKRVMETSCQRNISSLQKRKIINTWRSAFSAVFSAPFLS